MSNNYNNWELFCCEIKNPKDDDERYQYVDMLSVDSKHKRYILDVHCDERITDSYDENEVSVNCSNLSRDLFYILLDGLKRSGYEEYGKKEGK